jgi:hypothetical protein
MLVLIESFVCRSPGFGLTLVATSTTTAIHSSEANKTPEELGAQAAFELLANISRNSCIDKGMEWLACLLMALGSEDVGRVRIAGPLDASLWVVHRFWTTFALFQLLISFVEITVFGSYGTLRTSLVSQWRSAQSKMPRRRLQLFWMETKQHSKAMHISSLALVSAIRTLQRRRESFDCDEKMKVAGLVLTLLYGFAEHNLLMVCGHVSPLQRVFFFSLFSSFGLVSEKVVVAIYTWLTFCNHLHSLLSADSCYHAIKHGQSVVTDTLVLLVVPVRITLHVTR